MYEKILIPYDGSEESRKGAEHGIELAAALGSTVHVLYVMDLPGAPRSLSIWDDEEEMREEYRSYGEEVTGEIADLAAEHGVDSQTVIRSGSVHEEIVEYAEDEGMDAIVMVSAYKGKLGNILGGTTDKVVRMSTVPVISRRMRVDETATLEN
jgi:nucleotide-binding universal stress UspA family protein